MTRRAAPPQQTRISFDADHDEAHRLFVLACRRAIESQGASSTSLHVLSLLRLVFNFATRRGIRAPQWRLFKVDELADEFFLKRTAMTKVIERALATELLKRRPSDVRGARCPYEYTVDLQAANAWLRREVETTPAEANESPADHEEDAPGANDGPGGSGRSLSGNAGPGGPGRDQAGESMRARRTTIVASQPSMCARRTTIVASHTSYKEDSLRSCLDVESYSSVDGPFGAARFSGEETAAIGRRCARLAGDVRINSAEDRRLIVLAATLAERDLAPEDAVEQSREAVRLKKPAKPAAFFRSCLINQLARHGLDFHAIEAEAPLPAELLTAEPAATPPEPAA